MSSGTHILNRLESAALAGVNANTIHDCDALTVEAGCWLLDPDNAQNPFHFAVNVARVVVLEMVNESYGSGQSTND